MAAAVLQALQRRRIRVGDIDENFAAHIPGAEDSPEPAVLLSRIFAHIGHRLPLFKRIEKRLEGRDKRSGFGSDVTALLLQLFMRNRDIIEALVRELLAQQRTAKSTNPPKEGAS